MAANYLHGIEMIDVQAGTVPITVVKSAVIGLVGTAPTWLVPASNPQQPPQPNVPTLIGGSPQASAFGPMVQGYSIPYAFMRIFAQETPLGSGQVICVNVFNPLVHNTTVTSETHTMPATGVQALSVGHMGLIGPGLPNTPLSTASLDAVAQPGGAPSHSYVVADTITLAGGTYTTAAILTVATTQLVTVSLNAAGTAYVPGDEIALTGGTSSVAPQVEVVTTKVVSATVPGGSSGTGGTAGTQTVTGTTGTGTKFTASVTVSVGGAITAVLSITTGGSYSANPTAIATEPVTGAGLVGAQLDVVMGVNTISIVRAGSFTVNSATFTQGSTTGGGSGATFNAGVFGVLTATVSTAGSYSAVPSNPVSQASSTGSGLNAQFNMTFAGPATTVVVKNAGGSTTYVEGTDYSVDYINGVITQIATGAITTGQQLSVTYNYCDPSKVQDSDIIGAISGGVYTGLQAFLTCFGTMGFWPKLLCCPSKSQYLDVAAAMDTLAQTIRAMAYVDSPAGVTVAQALANRGIAGNAFDTSSKRTVLCFPHEKFVDNGIVPTGVTINNQGIPVQVTASAAVTDGPYSPWVVGVQAATDMRLGYWWSASNQQIGGPIVGPDVTMYMSYFDPNADCQTLNGAGILTVINSFGTGLRVFGNRSSAYPTYTSPDNFIPIRRTLDVIEESVQLAMIQFLDGPIDNGLINNVISSVNGFLRTLIQRGALIGQASCTYNPSDNPITQLEAGQVVWRISCMPPPPAERLTFYVTTDVTQLATLGPSATNSASNPPVL